MDLTSGKVEFLEVDNLAALKSVVIKPDQNLYIQFESTQDSLEPIFLKITQSQDSSLTLVCIFKHSIQFNLDLNINGDNTVSKIFNLVDLVKDSKVELTQKITTEFESNHAEHATIIVLNNNSSASVSHIAKANSTTKNLKLKQKIQALLLSPKTRVQMKPILQIESQDVSCRHGSTQGLLDLNAIFYLQSRGLNFETCKQLLINVFKAEILDMIKL